MSDRGIVSLSEAGTVTEERLIVRSFRPEDLDEVISLKQCGARMLCCDCETDFANITKTYFNRAHNHFWVAESQGKVVGTLALVVDEEVIAHLHCLLVAGDWNEGHVVRRRLIRVAASHARDHGSLKLVLHANVNEHRAAAYLHRLGFEFSRHREVNGKPALEFYLNLYQRPELGTGAA
ncbi:MAG TPA: GNAT family N-acetyltransferase [Phycisphaerae bacterium]|nr:GNAT family N-acetyltransferase [Phycisphaerae bacterium]